MRILLLNNLPTPYFIPLFQRLAGLGLGELTICFAMDWKSDLGWEEGSVTAQIETRTVYLKSGLKSGLASGHASSGNSLRQMASRASSALRMLKVLREERPDYVICYGYTLAPQLTLLLWALVRRIPFALIGDANIYCDKARGIRRILKRIWLRLLTWRAAAILTIGTASQLFWESYGAKAGKIFRVPFAVDNDHFARETEAQRLAAQRNLTRLGIDERVVFISVGRLIERKNIQLLIEALAIVNSAPDGDQAALLIVGAGDELRALEDLAGGDPRIIFAGRVTPAELPRWYAMADVMILAAHDEPWGLVTNEAMASGLAIIAHRECGSTVDLVDEQNGIVLDGFGVEELAMAMRRMIRDEQHLRQRQESSRRKIADWTIEAAAAGVARAVRETCRENRPHQALKR
jgi:glycosyltransferase involved in cell wall biosynthesis